VKLTQHSLSKIKSGARKETKSDHTEWDEELPGFGLRLRNDKASYIFQYRFEGRDWRIKLGEAPSLTADEARKLAQATKGQVSKAKLGHGLHPGAERDRQTEAFKQKVSQKAKSFLSFVPTYLEARRSGLKASTYEAQERHLNDHWKALHNLALNGVERIDVAASLTTITKSRGDIAANRARATLSKFFVWAIGEGLCDHNPVVGTNKRDENDPRERSLSDSEAAAVWLAAPENDYGRILKLILLTGCRRDEIGSLKWSEIDMEARTISLPKERTKNGQQHVVPLSDKALEILRSIPHRDRELVFGMRAGGFSGWSKSKFATNSATKLKEPWTLHDLRRTVRTGLGKLGVAPHIAEAVLNHLPAKLIRTYDRNTYAAEKKAALDLWAAHLMVAVAQATGANVTALHKGDSAASKNRRQQ
jgi:integrase